MVVWSRPLWDGSTQRPVAAGTLGSFEPVTRPGDVGSNTFEVAACHALLDRSAYSGPSLARTAAGAREGLVSKLGDKPASFSSPGGVGLIGISGDASSGARAPRQPWPEGRRPARPVSLT